MLSMLVPVAAIANCHKVGGFKTTEIPSLIVHFGGQKSAAEVPVGPAPSEGFMGESCLASSSF